MPSVANGPIDFHFQRSHGRLQNTSATGTSYATGSLNTQELRRLWQDRTLVSGDNLGPGDPGDFDHGAWHISCHLVAAGGVCMSRRGELLWLEISHADQRDEYYASVTHRQDSKTIETYRLESAEGRELLYGSRTLGYVEGSSKGRTSSRWVSDTPELFNLCRRQDYDQPTGSAAPGGKVWEHWCTLRDIRQSSLIATSIISSYVGLVSVLGDEFTGIVGRGRRQYGHPVQLAALVYTGFVDKKNVLKTLQPIPIANSVAHLLRLSTPASSLTAIERLDWGKPWPRYYMFPRRITSWAPSAMTRRIIEKCEDLWNQSLQKS